MNISIATVFPLLYKEFLETSLIKRAIENRIVCFDVASFSSVCNPKERIDSPVAGHGDGMIIKPSVLDRMVDHFESKHGASLRLFLTPTGKKLNQDLVKELAIQFKKSNHVILFAGRYEGFDCRAQDHYSDIEISIGDFILMAGDLAAQVVIESVLRYFPGVVAKEGSVLEDSFSDAFLDYPNYAVDYRMWNETEIPEILRSGDHAKIRSWRRDQACQKSILNNFSWVKSHAKSKDDIKLSYDKIPNHYVVLMHDNVVVDKDKIGCSSVTSIDIHDIARSSKTYGIKEYFLVTPLKDQQKIVNIFLNFWHTSGIEYNKNRSNAIENVTLSENFENVIESIFNKNGKMPIVISTSAKKYDDIKNITYFDQELIFKQDRPVLFVLGTAKGLSDDFIKKCDYLLLPIKGFSDFNHLSVRSAAAIIFDRWLGINLTNV